MEDQQADEGAEPAGPPALARRLGDQVFARPPASPRRSLRSRADRLRPYVPALVGSAVVGTVCVRAILARAGHPAAPLDDSFIHLQYARRLAEGGFFDYVAGEGYTTGATSLLWPLILAPFYAVGLRDLSLLWAAWALGTLAHAALAVEVFRLTRPLAGRVAALAAGAMCIVFGAFAWFAWSGMETLPFAWALTRTARLAADRFEPTRAPPPSDGALVAMGIVAPLLRPEGALASLLAAFALLMRPSRPGVGARALCLAPLAGPLVVPLQHLAFSGHAASSTTTVKWLVGNPYYQGGALRGAIEGNLRLLWSSVLDGGDWTALFLPEGFRIPLGLGVLALGACAHRSKSPWRAGIVLVLALGTVLPVTYLSFLWNRVRYVWPFAGAWFVLLACFSRAVGWLVRAARTGAPDPTALVAGCFVGALATKLPWSVRDLAQSAHAIDRQQVALGRWIHDTLPAEARVGVNDTGAIAYLGGRRTFDVVGLTTEGEARHWVAGAGSRFEHYERLDEARRPTHFAVYPHWMACSPVLGRVLTEATVLDQSILGGTTMVVYEARWNLLGSGARPRSGALASATVLDEVDVADLESERDHAWSLEGAADGESHAALDWVVPDAGEPISRERSERRGEAEGRAENPIEIADGGRTNRRRDRFFVELPAGGARLAMRVSAEGDAKLDVRIGDAHAASLSLRGGRWVELVVPIPASATGRTQIEVAASAPDARFSSYHYWVLSPP